MNNGHLRKDLLVLTINETWYCPIRCSYCHIAQKASLKDKRILSSQNLIKACKVAKKLKFREYRFSGGEPTSIGNKLFDHAKIVFETVGLKPALLTSGYNLSEEWFQNAANLFSGIYISVESPIKPFHSITNTDKLLSFIRENSSDKLPLRLGVTLIRPECYEHLHYIFSYLYEGTNKKSYPQLSSPSLKDYIAPTPTQLKHLQSETAKIFADYGIIPYYFTDFIGSVLYTENRLNRYVVNLNPDGSFHPFSSLNEGLRNAISMRQQELSKRVNCASCDWFECCNPFDEGINIHYSDLCNLRKAIFKGILKGLEIYSNDTMG